MSWGQFGLSVGIDVCLGKQCSCCSEAQEWASEPKECASYGNPLAARLCWRVGGHLLWRTGQVAQREPGREWQERMFGWADRMTGQQLV